jgi:hypothetical protein
MNRLMSHMRILTALWELLYYDVLSASHGFQGVCRNLKHARSSRKSYNPAHLTSICQAVTWASSLYCKRVQCLQRSVVTAVLLRRVGADAQVVIGYRPAPFFSHAWVEIEGRVVNDSSGYQSRLHILTRL